MNDYDPVLGRTRSDHEQALVDMNRRQQGGNRGSYNGGGTGKAVGFFFILVLIFGAFSERKKLVSGDSTTAPQAVAEPAPALPAPAPEPVKKKTKKAAKP